MNHHPLMPVYRGLLALLLFVSAQVFAADGVIQSASGDIFINGNPASQGDEVSSGDTLKTAFGAWMVVEMEDQSVLNIRSNSEVEVTDYIYNPASPEQNSQQVNLVDGTLRFTSGLIAQNDNEDVGVRAGDYTIGVRGTELTAVYNRSTGKLDLSVTSGRVGIWTYGAATTGGTQVGNMMKEIGAGEKATVELSEGGRIFIQAEGADGKTEGAYYTVTGDADGNLSLQQSGDTYVVDTTDAFNDDYYTDYTTKSSPPTFNQAITNTDE